MKFIFPGFDTDCFIVFHDYFIYLDIGSNERIHSKVAGINSFLNFSGQPVIKLRTKYHYPSVRSFIEVFGFEIQGKSRLLIHKGESSVIDVSFPASVFFFPIIRDKFVKITTPKHTTGHIFCPGKFSFLNEEKFHVISGKRHCSSKACYTCANYDTIKFIFHNCLCEQMRSNLIKIASVSAEAEFSRMYLTFNLLYLFNKRRQDFI